MQGRSSQASTFKGKERGNVKRVELPHCEMKTNQVSGKLSVLGGLVEITLHKGMLALQQLLPVSTNSS